MTDDGLMASSAATGWKLPRDSGMVLAFLVLALSVLGPRSPGAHETIDADGVNAILAATDTAAARVQSFAGRHAPFHAECAVACARIAGEAAAI